MIDCHNPDHELIEMLREVVEAVQTPYDSMYDTLAITNAKALEARRKVREALIKLVKTDEV